MPCLIEFRREIDLPRSEVGPVERVEFALLAAGVVVQKAGTATASPDEVIEAESRNSSLFYLDTTVDALKPLGFSNNGLAP